MMPPVEIALLQLKKDRRAEGVAPIDDNDDNYVFVNKVGKPIDKHLDEVWGRALKKAGLRHRPSYQLRHTFVTTCINKNLPLPYISPG
jgi:integrase